MTLLNVAREAQHLQEGHGVVPIGVLANRLFNCKTAAVPTPVLSFATNPICKWLGRSMHNSISLMEASVGG